MSDGEPLAVVKDYDGLHAALRARVDALAVSYESVDQSAGLPDRYASKLLSPHQVRNIGLASLWPLLRALGLELQLVERADSADLLRRLQKRKLTIRSRVRNAKRLMQYGRAAQREITERMRELNRRNASKGGKHRFAKMTFEQRRASALKAVNARWARVRKRKARHKAARDTGNPTGDQPCPQK